MNRIALCLSIAALMMSVAAFWTAVRRDDAALVLGPQTTPLPFQMLPNATLTGCARILPPDPQRCAD